jgi:hypothetical protein
MDLQLASVYNGQLIFEWDKFIQCSPDSLRYEINATGCGNCPNHTVNNNVTCRKVPTNLTGESLCMFTVKAIVCESSESSSNRVIVALKGSVKVYYKLVVMIVHFISVIS